MTDLQAWILIVEVGILALAALEKPAVGPRVFALRARLAIGLRIVTLPILEALQESRPWPGASQHCAEAGIRGADSEALRCSV